MYFCRQKQINSIKMAQGLYQTQEQKQQQLQRLSQQQMLQVRLLEMPIAELEDAVSAELNDNPALETGRDDDSIPDDAADSGESEEDYERDEERDERADELDSALERMGSDDEMPSAESYGSNNKDNADYEEIVYGDTTSFIDKLNEQMNTCELTDKQHSIMEYLIGSLDDDGLLRKDLGTISDELAIYHNVDASEKEIEDALKILQTFDPAGIGARSLQECLQLQIQRKKDSKLKDLMLKVVGELYDEFIKNHWDKISTQLGLNELQTKVLQDEIRKLNPKPGASMGEAMGRNTQQITPDFIVDTADDGTVTFTLNNGNIPQLHVSPAFTEMLSAYKDNKKGMNRQTKEALLYAKEKIDKAQGYIEAIRQRRHTLYVTMKAIIDIQKKFFQDGDEADLKPMILKDVADRTGLDISTISRVSNIKYAQTKWGTFPLRFFFSDSYTTNNGEELSTRKIKLALKDIIDKEDKTRPLSDEALAKAMADKGYPIARRTIAKYREQMDIPVARMRKQ